METQQNHSAHGHKFNVGFFFLNLGVLVTLITTVVFFLNLVFETLNKKFPDVLNATYQYGYSTYQFEDMRTAIATLIIFFPVFLIISHYWRKMYAKGVGPRDEHMRKWLIYVILFMTSIVLVIDLVTLIKFFLAGEITTRFIIKVLAVLVVSAKVGFYYVLELKNKQRIFGFRVGLWAAIKSSILVLLILVLSFMVMGSPFKQRQLRLDDRRLGDLQNIQYQVINYWQQKEKLPATLEDLKNPTQGNFVPVPPEFEKGEVYEYKVTGPLKFELCGTFALPMPKGWQENYYGYGGGGPMPMFAERDVAVSMPYPGPGGINESWDHQAGRTCFERTIDRDIYPPYPKPFKY